MFNLSENEVNFICENFGSIENFDSFYKDKLLFDLQTEKKSPMNIDLTPYSSDGVVTGLFISMRTEENKLKVDMLVRGSYRVFDIEDCCAENFIKVKKQLLEDVENCCWSVEDINNFIFVQKKPFLLTVENNIITNIKPLDFALYENCIELWKKIPEIFNLI